MSTQLHPHKLPQELEEKGMFVPIKKGTKRPIGSGWQKGGYPWNKAKNMSKQPYQGHQVGALGILCGEPSGGLLLLDHDGESCDRLLEQWQVDLPEGPTVTSGRPGRYQQPFWVPPPFWTEISTAKYKTGELGPDGEQEQIELRWDGCQSLVLGFHPETGNRYSWSRQDLPIPNAPLELLERMLEQDVPAPSPELPFHTDNGPIPLEKLLAIKHREWLQVGVGQGMRNDSAYAIASDLLGIESFCRTYGQPYQSSAQSLYEAFCDRCSPPIGTKERSATWNSALKSSPEPCLSQDKLQNCIEAWNKPQRQHQQTSNAPSSTSATYLPPEQPEGAGRLRQVIRQYSACQEPFQRALLEAQISKQFQVRGNRLQQLVEALDPKVDSEPTFMAELCLDVLAQIEKRAVNPGIQGFKTGFTDFDSLTMGLQPGDLIVIAGRPSMGKTALCLNFAYQVAKLNPITVAFFSLEMSKEQVQYRLLSADCEIPAQRLISGRLNDAEWARLATSAGELTALAIAVDDTPALTPSTIERKAIQCSSGAIPLGVIFVDYLQLMESDSNSENRNIAMSKITRQLKGIARRLNVAVVALSQLSRAVETRSEKRPMMSDLRDSGGIEQDADLVGLMYRDSYYKETAENTGLAELILAKNRNGPTGTIQLLFEAQYTRFRNYERYRSGRII